MRNRLLKGAWTLAALLPTLAMAQQQPAHREGSWELGLGGGVMFLDPSLRDFLGSGAPEYRFANSTSPSRVTPFAYARVGHHFTRHFGFSITGGGAMGSGVTYLTPNASIMYSVDLNATTSPYLLIGTEFTRISGNNGRVTHSTWGAQAGLGLRHMVSERVALRLEGRVRFEGWNEVPMSRKTTYSPVVTLGLSYFAGGRQPPVPVAAAPQRVRVDTVTVTQVRRDTVTVARVRVDTVRVEEAVDQLILRVQFQTNLSTLLPRSRPVLDSIATAMLATPESRWEIMGHTDSVGTAEFNQALSQARAQSVLDYLVTKGVDRASMTAHGYGFSRPVFSNATLAGRAENRRVQLRRRPNPPIGPAVP